MFQFFVFTDGDENIIGGISWMQSTLIDAQMAGVVGNALRDNGN
jgi:hypothetical protein